MDLILRINEQFVSRASNNASDFIESSRVLTEEVADQNQTEEVTERDNIVTQAQQQQQQPKSGTLTEEDKSFIEMNNVIVSKMKEARNNSSRDELIRNTVYKEITAFFDYSFTELENLNEITCEIFTQLGAFSYDVQAYREWLRNRKVEPLVPKPDPTPEEIAAEIEERRQRELREKLRLEEEEAAKKAKKTAKKDTKKKEEEKKDEPPSVQVTQPEKTIEDKKVEEKKFDLSYYHKQLGTLNEETITPGLCLEAIIDQITHQSSGASESFHQLQP